MQSCIADSTMEAEYVVALEAAKKEVWLRNFLLDLGVVPSMHLLFTVIIVEQLLTQRNLGPIRRESTLSTNII